MKNIMNKRYKNHKADTQIYDVLTNHLLSDPQFDSEKYTLLPSIFSTNIQ